MTDAEVSRRRFLRLLLAGATLTAGGLYVPQRIYSFLWDNPLARPQAGTNPYRLDGLLKSLGLERNTVIWADVDGRIVKFFFKGRLQELSENERTELHLVTLDYRLQ